MNIQYSSHSSNTRPFFQYSDTFFSHFTYSSSIPDHFVRWSGNNHIQDSVTSKNWIRNIQKTAIFVSVVVAYSFLALLGKVSYLSIWIDVTSFLVFHTNVTVNIGLKEVVRMVKSNLFLLKIRTPGFWFSIFTWLIHCTFRMAFLYTKLIKDCLNLKTY